GCVRDVGRLDEGSISNAARYAGLSPRSGRHALLVPRRPRLGQSSSAGSGAVRARSFVLVLPQRLVFFCNTSSAAASDRALSLRDNSRCNLVSSPLSLRTSAVSAASLAGRQNSAFHA